MSLDGKRNPWVTLAWSKPGDADGTVFRQYVIQLEDKRCVTVNFSQWVAPHVVDAELARLKAKYAAKEICRPEGRMNDDEIRARVDDAIWEALQGQLYGFYIGGRDDHKNFDGKGNDWVRVDGYLSPRLLAEAAIAAIKAETA